MLRYVPRFPNLIVLKSFSNLYAMPGARLGYCITSNPVLLEKLNALAALPVLTAGACLAGVAALKDAGLAVYHSDANFVLVRSELPSFADELAARDIKVKRCDGCTGLSDAYCRIAVRTAAENNRLVAAVREILTQ